MIQRMTCFLGSLLLVLLIHSSALAAETEPQMSEAHTEASAESWDRLGVDEPSTRARTELAIFQLYHGLFYGMQSCSVFDCDNPQVYSSLVTSGGALGLGGSVLLTRGGITSGQARAINSGSLWGAGTGAVAAGLIAEQPGRTVLRTMLVTQAAGTGAGYLLSNHLRPTGGDVRLVNSVGLWAGIYYLLITEGVLQMDQTAPLLGIGLLASTTAGAIVGSQLAIESPMSASRVAIISASGLVGGYFGSALPIFFSGQAGSLRDARLEAILALAGITAGLGIGANLTQEWDSDEPAYQRTAMSFSLLPTNDGDGLQGAIMGRF